MKSKLLFLFSLIALQPMLAMEQKQEELLQLFKKNQQLLKLVEKRDVTVEQVQQLLDAGADVNAQDKYGNTPLIWATKRCNFKLVKMLITHGASVNIQNNNGDTPLLWAAFNRNTQIAAFLIANGAYVDTLDKNFNSPLIWAVRKGGVEVAELLLANGANINARNKLYITPLTFAAAKNRNLPIVKMLIKNGANIHAQDKEGRTALSATWYTQMTAAFLKQVIEDREKLSSAIYQESLETVLAILQRSPIANCPTKYGTLPLMQAVQEGNFDICQTLLRAGAKPTLSKDGINAFNYANFFAKSEILQLLKMPPLTTMCVRTLYKLSAKKRAKLLCKLDKADFEAATERFPLLLQDIEVEKEEIDRNNYIKN